MKVIYAVQILFIWMFSYFLLESVGGRARTLMFVHINPEVNAIGETISTLKFAGRVASIDLGAAHSNKETGEIRELKEEVCFFFTIAHLLWGGTERILSSGNVQCLASYSSTCEDHDVTEFLTLL